MNADPFGSVSSAEGGGPGWCRIPRRPRTALHITKALPVPAAARPPLQPYGSSRPVRGTGRAELSGFGKAETLSDLGAVEQGVQRATVLALSHDASVSSSISPLATESMTETTASSLATIRRPFSPRNTNMAWKATRLFPSTNG